MIEYTDRVHAKYSLRRIHGCTCMGPMQLNTTKSISPGWYYEPELKIILLVSAGIISRD